LLVGQPELLTRLMEPSLRQFHQRIGARAILNPLQRVEAFEYIEHKLRESGSSTKKIFGKRALQLLVHHSHGIPRQLNLLCNNALIRTYGSDLRVVTVKVAREAIREYENLSGIEEELREPLGRRALHPITSHAAISLAGFSLIAVLGLYFLGVTIPNIPLVISGVLKTNLTPYPETALNDTSQNAVPTFKAPEGSISDAAVGRSPTSDPLVHPTQHLPNNGPANRLAHDVASSPGSTPSVSVANSDRGAQSKSHKAVAYKVQVGDTIEEIALHHVGSTVKSLQAANPQLRDVNRIYPGDTIFLPAGTAFQPRAGNDLSGGLKRGSTDASARSGSED
jgi:LysM repeat protein